MQPLSELLLTTSQVADLFDVHASTVKRWAEDDGLRAEKTAGGHRRISLRSALDFSKQRGIRTFLDPFRPDRRQVWLALQDAEHREDFSRIRDLAMDWIRTSDPVRLTALIADLVDRAGLALESVSDHAIHPFMTDIDIAWQEGRIRTGERILGRQALLEALYRLSPTGRHDPHAGNDSLDRGFLPVAVVGSTEEEEHPIDSLRMRVQLERHGWQVLHLGSRSPTEEFAALQRQRGATLVCISLSPPAVAARMRCIVDVLREFYRPECPYDLIFGGYRINERWAGAPSAPFRSVRVLPTATELAEWLRSDPSQRNSDAWRDTA